MRLKLIADSNEEIELNTQQLDLSKDYCNIVYIDSKQYPSEALLSMKQAFEAYLPNVLLVDKSIEVKQIKIEK